MSAISGTRRALKELVDGTIRVQIDIDPRFKKQFLELFPTIDMPVAIAPLNPEFEKWDEETRLPPKQPQGPLCQLAARWCKDRVFRHWLGVVAEDEAAEHIRRVCGIPSRKFLDQNAAAADMFNETIREPYMKFRKDQYLE